MQRQLLQISDRVPDDILLTLLKCFAQVLTREPEPSPKTPFIRAFAKICEDNQVERHPTIKEEDEETSVAASTEIAEENAECSFNYKVSSVVTQEVAYSLNNNNNNSNDEQESSAEVDADAAIDASTDNNNNSDVDNQIETNEDQIEAKDDDNLNDAMATSGDAIDEGIEVEMPKLDAGQNVNDGSDSNGNVVEEKFNDIVDDEKCEEATNGHDADDESWSPQVEVIAEPAMETVSLDDIQREIQEMQMFLQNKKRQEEDQQQQEEQMLINQQIKNSKNIDDAFKVDVCINLKKKSSSDGHKRHSKSKAILASYLHDQQPQINGGKYTRGDKERPMIFDPKVPNTPEDFLKEKSVTEKINKKKQKIKNLDVSWQKLCDNQKKVYK
jgi:hypothetical protein